MQTPQAAAKVPVSGGHHFSLHQRLAQGAAGFKRRVVGRFRADHALANEVHPCAVAVTLPTAAVNERHGSLPSKPRMQTGITDVVDALLNSQQQC